jgi:hypothetical protein
MDSLDQMHCTQLQDLKMEPNTQHIHIWMHVFSTEYEMYTFGT